jgi:asparagine synthase (glutamine-hydrolysing)
LPKNASETLKVVLSGEGGDEAFMGYDHQRAFMKMNKIGDSGLLRNFVRIMLSICPPRLLSMFNSYPGAFGSEEHARIKHVFEKLNSPCDAYIQLISLYDDVEMPTLFDRSFLSHAPTGPDRDTIRETFSQDQHLWQSVMRLEIEQLTLIVNLLKQDRFSMRFSIEGRVPLVSRSVLDFASALPVEKLLHKINKEYLLNYSNSKPLLKRPFSIFASPIYAKIIIDLMEKYVNRASVEECGILSWETANQITERMKKGGMLAIKKAMALVVFMIWWKVFRTYIKK